MSLRSPNGIDPAGQENLQTDERQTLRRPTSLHVLQPKLVLRLGLIILLEAIETETKQPKTIWLSWTCW